MSLAHEKSCKKSLSHHLKTHVSLSHHLKKPCFVKSPSKNACLIYSFPELKSHGIPRNRRFIEVHIRGVATSHTTWRYADPGELLAPSTGKNGRFFSGADWNHGFSWQ